MSDDIEKGAAKRLDELIDLHFMEWDATLPPDIKDWKGVAVVSEPRRVGKSYWRERAETAEGRLIDAGYRQAEDRAEIEALRAQLAGRCLSEPMSSDLDFGSPCPRCGHPAVEHHGVDKEDGCLFGSRFSPCPCDLTATEAASPREVNR